MLIHGPWKKVNENNANLTLGKQQTEILIRNVRENSKLHISHDFLRRPTDIGK